MEGTPERERLLGLVVDLVLREGVIDLSLSAVARSIGSNNRMLLYYFGSKEALLDEAGLRALDRFALLREMFNRLSGPGGLEERLLASWDDLSAPENLPYLRLYFQRFGVAMRDTAQWQTFIERAGRQWVELTRAVFTSAGYSDADSLVAATQIIALWRGLQFLLLSGVPTEQLGTTYAIGVRGLLAQLTPVAAARRESNFSSS
ncbi:TetR/AcrR family transcriptional regulator [Cryobacterium sp.]|uniref:TetR/AcrR family transcriptional regulator n=1 Tax=Cryobacterium sp. TaxID=1926290 RepID=UPI00262304BB|nr:TetR/AcrR family transcriptional regulator [Cryobacterium sp.]